MLLAEMVASNLKMYTIHLPFDVLTKRLVDHLFREVKKKMWHYQSMKGYVTYKSKKKKNTAQKAENILAEKN